MTRTFHIVGGADIPCPEEHDGTIKSKEKNVMGYVNRFVSPKGNNTFKAKLEGYWIISDEELNKLKYGT